MTERQVTENLPSVVFDKNLMPKSQLIYYSFVCMLISPLCLILSCTCKAKRANWCADKRILNWPPFWNKVYSVYHSIVYREKETK